MKKGGRIAWKKIINNETDLLTTHKKSPGTGALGGIRGGNLLMPDDYFLEKHFVVTSDGKEVDSGGNSG
jgi:hypothetical protein